MSILLGDAHGWSDSVLTAMLGFAFRATVILLAAWGATRLLRSASAATRHLVWSGAITAVLLIPLLGAVVPVWNVPVVSVQAGFDSPLTPAPSASSASVVASTISAPSATSPSPTLNEEVQSEGPASFVSRADLDLAAVLGVAWLGLALLLIARLAIANARVSAWQRASRPVEDAHWLALLRQLTRQYRIERPVVLLESQETDIPVTWGIVYPVILIPASAEDWDDEQRIAVLTHELAHVKRFDALTQQLGQLALALLWFHPLVWIAVRRMRLEREHACDDFVLAAGARASRYADDLLALARRLSRPTAPAAAALAMARRSELEGRLLAILDPAVKRNTVRRARVAVLTLAVFAFAAPLAAFRPGTRVVTTAPALATTDVQTPQPVVAEPKAEVKAAESRVVSTDERTLEMLAQRVGQVSQLSPSALHATKSLRTLIARTDTEPQRPVDVQTLIDVAKAAKRMTSDYERSQLLQLIAKRYVRNDELRDAYLDAVAGISSDHDRGVTLIALLERDSLPAGPAARVLRTAALMSSDASRSHVLKRITPAVFSDSAVQKAYVGVLNLMSSSTERAAAMAVLIKEPNLSQSNRLALLRATNGMTSNSDKAAVLLLFIEKQGLADEAVKRAFFKSAETFTSDAEYRRVMAAVMR